MPSRSPTRVRVSERAFQTGVLELARRYHWLTYHTHDSRRSQPGFPDLVMVRERVVFAELKASAAITDSQATWLRSLREAGAEVCVWTPNDWPEIELALSKRRPAAPIRGP